MISASRSAKAVVRTKYAPTVAVKSPMKTEGKKQRKIMRRKNGNHCVTMRFGTDGWENDRANRKFTAFDRGVLESADKRQRVDNASFSDMCQ